MRFDMKLTVAYGLFHNFFLILISFAAGHFLAAADHQTPLTCNVTRKSDGSFLYHLSRPPSSSQCTTCWELQNKTVIARNSDFVSKLVQNLTNHLLISKDCHTYLHYTVDCFEVWNDAHCHVNCSLLLDDKGIPQPTVNTTLICFTESSCFNKLTFGLSIIGGIILLALCVFFLYYRNICKCKRGETGASYTLANGEIHMEDISVIKVAE